MTSGASKEANKDVAKDSDASLSTRATAAKDAAGDKLDESKHSVSIQEPHLQATMLIDIHRPLLRATSKRLLTRVSSIF